MFDRFFTFIRSLFNAMLGRIEDPQLLLEQTYQDLNGNLIQVRQAVAQAMAAEKQIEQQMLKNKEQAQTWHNRAAMAVQQSNDDLAKQALQRKQQYVLAATEQEKLLNGQHESVMELRSKLTDLEGEVQKAYFRKQELINKDKFAQAKIKASESLSRTTADGALSVMDRMEEKVHERLAKADALSELGSDTLEKQFKNLEGRSDLDSDLAALKNQLGVGGPTKIEIKEPVLLEENAESHKTVDAQEVREVPEQN